MKRILSPSLNPAGLSSAVLALYALGTGIWNVAHHAGAVDPQVIVAAVAAVAALFTRQVVTPVKDPKNGAFEPLMTCNQHAAANLKAALASGARATMMTEVPKRNATRIVDGRLEYFDGTAWAEYVDLPTINAEPAPPRPPSSDPRERSAQ